jgi:hypothetical protein
MRQVDPVPSQAAISAFAGLKADMPVHRLPVQSAPSGGGRVPEISSRVPSGKLESEQHGSCSRFQNDAGFYFPDFFEEAMRPGSKPNDVALLGVNLIG